VLANATEWSKKNMAGFKNFGRVVGRITLSRGQGRGAVLGVVRLRPGAQDAEAVRAKLRAPLDPGMLPGVISLHLVESDPALSKNLNEPDAPNPGAGDRYVLIDGSGLGAIRALMRSSFAAPGAAVISTGTYRLLWDLAKSNL
jgi:hypothetical protein